ncbi:hypothetical protein HaLaN_06119 [Haematococcus lacustris]|uniref:Uncharacterized protein n=1 Tax=Haematococcus lacustris TaxID=44745 RepID=A0A699YL11_HAELA|nr:hypothetical protein HaLaN_06119 [Haematococcus lacustris]
MATHPQTQPPSMAAWLSMVEPIRLSLSVSAYQGAGGRQWGDIALCCVATTPCAWVVFCISTCTIVEGTHGAVVELEVGLPFLMHLASWRGGGRAQPQIAARPGRVALSRANVARRCRASVGMGNSHCYKLRQQLHAADKQLNTSDFEVKRVVSSQEVQPGAGKDGGHKQPRAKISANECPLWMPVHEQQEAVVHEQQCKDNSNGGWAAAAGLHEQQQQVAVHVLQCMSNVSWAAAAKAVVVISRVSSFQMIPTPLVWTPPPRGDALMLQTC